jgi:4'-phosphopantetheinyl transferase
MSSLAEDRIDLWLALHEEINDAALLARYRQLLSEQERARELRFVRGQDRVQFLLTRVLVRTVLSRYVAVSPAQWRFSTLEHGKPVIENEAARQAGLSFNIAHTQGLVALAVSKRRQLGVDVERLTRRPVSLAIAERYFAAEEVAALMALPRTQQMSRFFEYWTLKEAYIKARGLGLAIPLDQFSFGWTPDGAVRLSIAPSLGDQPTRWQFWQRSPADDYALAVCAERSGTASLELAMARLDPFTLHA